LSSSERHHRLLAANSTDLITRFALDGTITYASPACVGMLGYAAQEIVGQHIADLIHPEDRAAHAEREAQIGSAAEMTISEARLRHRDGHYLWCEATVREIRDGNGTVTERQSAIRDIEDRKQLGLMVEHQRDEANAMLAFNDALAQIATLVATGAEPNATFATVAEQVGRLFGAMIGGVVRFDGPAGTGEIVGGWSAEDSAFAGQTIDLAGTSAAAQVYRTGTPVQTGGLNEEVAGAIGLHSDASGAICSPIVVGGRVWGSVGAAFAVGRGIAPDAGVRLTRFAELVAVAIANAQTLATLAEQAATDPMTGLANHRTFHEVLRMETERAFRHGRVLSVALFDVDHFKWVNDTHGHLTGDEVLAAVAHLLAGGARSGDTIARTGGEEFAWLMPETTQDAAYLAAEHVRREIESTTFASVGRLTISAGVCSNQHATAAHDLFRAADRALYSAKRTGRNVTVIHSEQRSRAQPA
jgi:diguanylate cyclase (GGDEF)-like protein/PAS domain S-box-containing protein